MFDQTTSQLTDQRNQTELNKHNKQTKDGDRSTNTQVNIN